MTERQKRTAGDVIDEILTDWPDLDRIHVARATLEAVVRQTRRHERQLQVALQRVTELETHLATSGEDMEVVT